MQNKELVIGISALQEEGHQFFLKKYLFIGFPRSKESTWQCRRQEFRPWSGKISRASEQLSPCVTLLSLGTATTEDHVPRARAPQREKPP